MGYLDSDPVDYLPHIDGNITDSERFAVEQLIRAEMPSEIGHLHPQIQALASLSESRSLLIRGLESLDTEDPEDFPQEPLLSGGISMERYTNFESGNEMDFNLMYTTLSYSILRDRNARLGAENAEENAGLRAAAMENLERLEKAQRDVISRKREHTEEIHSTRRAKQAQFEPVQGYLEQRWKEGIKGLVDMGIERSLS